MAKRPRTPKQLANDERLRNRRKTDPDLDNPVTEKPDVNWEQMQKQLDEVMETNALLRAAILGNQQNPTSQNIGVGQGGKLLGEVDKYLVDPSNYPDPTPRLSQEPRLQTIAFNHNYELEYDFTIRSYETRTGVNMREPEFTIRLLRCVLDDQGERVKVEDPKTRELRDKFYIARRMMFHEDPQAALVIARENNLDVDKDDEKHFLDEMRYLRVRDWLFDFFWPKGTETREGIKEEAIGGTIVQVYTKSSVEPSQVDFDKLSTKV